MRNVSVAVVSIVPVTVAVARRSVVLVPSWIVLDNPSDWSAAPVKANVPAAFTVTVLEYSSSAAAVPTLKAMLVPAGVLSAWIAHRAGITTAPFGSRGRVTMSLLANPVGIANVSTHTFRSWLVVAPLARLPRLRAVTPSLMRLAFVEYLVAMFC